MPAKRWPQCQLQQQPLVQHTACSMRVSQEPVGIKYAYAPQVAAAAVALLLARVSPHHSRAYTLPAATEGWCWRRHAGASRLFAPLAVAAANSSFAAVATVATAMCNSCDPARTHQRRVSCCAHKAYQAAWPAPLPARPQRCATRFTCTHCQHTSHTQRRVPRQPQAQLQHVPAGAMTLRITRHALRQLHGGMNTTPA
jgi:hypothetical protein